MLALLAILTLGQATSPATDAPVVETVGEVKPLGRKAGFFTEPRVTPGVLVGRIGMGTLFGSVVGGALATGVSALGILVTAVGLWPLTVLAVALSAGVLGIGTALGAAMFGEDYGRDLSEAMIPAMLSALVAAIIPVVTFFVAPLVVLGPVVAVSLLIPAVATPLFVQALKPDERPVATVAIAHF